MNWPAYTRKHCCHPVVHHQVTCIHQIEVEVQPASAEVYFADERYVDAINTQVRFEATVYNAPNNSVTWQVTDISGGPGKGTIDPSGLYIAPPKDGVPHGHTDIIIATVKADPTRRAYAKVTLVGRGPEPEPVAKLEIYPQVAYLYYQDGAGVHNQYIDPSNKHQQFSTIIKNTSLTGVTWSVTGAGSINSDGFYTAPYSGFSPAFATVQVYLTLDSSIKAVARIILLNYSWPGIVP